MKLSKEQLRNLNLKYSQQSAVTIVVPNLISDIKNTLSHITSLESENAELQSRVKELELKVQMTQRY